MPEERRWLPLLVLRNPFVPKIEVGGVSGEPVPHLDATRCLRGRGKRHNVVITGVLDGWCLGNGAQGDLEILGARMVNVNL